ncbi:hypothetical protein NPS46_07125 [Pseudomonas putida]|uniref:hypothetical protein n=1 Tax=Pseudomonas putida TaxID=303 RepID=UPI002364A01C|nr:hypothetical protein [Pseudomonas putida]MDD2052317.1 hypothetical protein [Pseudomonas putida]
MTSWNTPQPVMRKQSRPLDALIALRWKVTRNGPPKIIPWAGRCSLRVLSPAYSIKIYACWNLKGQWNKFSFKDKKIESNT